MPISRCASDRSRGFTLVEMLVVLTILGIAAALLAGRYGTQPSGVARERIVAELRSRITTARREAVRTGAPTRLNLADLDDDATLEAPLFDQGSLVFFPDGSASGGTIAVAGQRVLVVDWLTGEVSRAP